MEIAPTSRACCLQAAGVVGVVPWNYVNDVSDDVMVTSHGVYAAVSQQGVLQIHSVTIRPPIVALYLMTPRNVSSIIRREVTSSEWRCHRLLYFLFH